MYWHQGWEEAPYLVKECAESWKFHHQANTWEVHLLDHHNVQPWLKDCDQEDVTGLTRFLTRQDKGEKVGGLALYADLLRLALLNTYGGIWVDATALCFQPLDTWLPTPTNLGMPRSLAAERRTETWFIDNRAQDPLLTLWKNRYRDLYFSENNNITYLDNWSSRPFQLSYWLLNLGMRSKGLNSRVWNGKLALHWLKIRPYFATNSAFEYVVRNQLTPERTKTLHRLILPIDSELMWDIHVSDWSQPMSPFTASRFLSAPFLKLNHKDKWAGQFEQALLNPKSAIATWIQRARTSS